MAFLRPCPDFCAWTTGAGSPGLLLKLAVLAILALLIVAPMARTVLFTLAPGTVIAWSEVLLGRLAPNLFWWPLVNTMIIGVIHGLACVLLGGFLAWPW